MHHSPSKKKIVAKLAVIYTIMIIATVSIVTFIVLFMLGYRFDTAKGQIEQYGLLQFASTPSGGTVKVDDTVVGSNTPTKKTVEAGVHKVVMWRDGYETWSKTVEVKSGTLIWLNYALFVPKKLSVELVANFESVASSLASPKGRFIFIQTKTDSSTFELVDTSSDTIKASKITIPISVVSSLNVAGVAHAFSVIGWDDGEKYVLVKHTYSDKTEWIVVDTTDVAQSKNITKITNLAISDLKFFGTDGHNYYGLISGELKKIDISSNTASKAYATGVQKFDIYNKANMVSYISTDATDSTQQNLGLYRDGDERTYIIKTIKSNIADIQMSIARYYNVDYVAISNGQKVEILGGSYPTVDRDTSTSLKNIANISLGYSIKKLQFSPQGQYVFIQNGADFASYNLEYQELAQSKITCSGDIKLNWLNDYYLWSDCGDKLTIREFDGQNSHTINSVTAGQDAVLIHNGRYLYSFNKATVGYQLQRVRMILP